MGGGPGGRDGGDGGPVPGDRVLDRLVGESVSRGPGLLSSLGHQALARRLASDSSNAITSGWRSHRRTRSYGRHSRLVCSIAAGRRVRSSSITARWASIPSDRARERLTSDAAHTTATTASTKIATALTTRSQTPIVVSTDLLFHVLVFDGGYRGDRHDLVVRGDAHHDHALRLAADTRDRPRLRPKHHAARTDDEHFLFGIAHDTHRCELSNPTRALQGEHSLASPMLHRGFGDRRPLAVAPLRDDEQVAARRRRCHAGHRVSLAELDADHPLCVTAHRADLGFAEADRLA